MSSKETLGRPRLITLLTDFGLSDAYVGVIKGVILSRAPGVQLVDLTHDVAPQAVVAAAFLLETAWPFFPKGSVHVVIVDPGVGTARRRLVLSAGGQLFVGPDNGVLSAALPDERRGRRGDGEAYVTRRVALNEEVIAVAIENEALFRQPVSATFEGRDVFAPAAAHLAAGGALAELGPRVGEVEALPAFRAPKRGRGLDGQVLHVDRFGNLITDLLAADLPPEPSFTTAGRRLRLATTYAASGGLTAIVGSSGFVEIALPNGSAASVLGAGPGDRVSVA